MCLRQSGSPLGAWPGPEPWGGGGGARSEAGVTEGRGLPVAAQVRPLGPAGQVGQVGPAPPSGRPRAGGSAAASGLGHRPGSRVQVRRLPGRGSQLLGTTPAPGQVGTPARWEHRALSLLGHSPVALGQAPEPPTPRTPQGARPEQGLLTKRRGELGAHPASPQAAAGAGRALLLPLCQPGEGQRGSVWCRGAAASSLRSRIFSGAVLSVSHWSLFLCGSQVSNDLCPTFSCLVVFLFF